jgi:NitT/TauT family transport system ATP-binding protein
MTNTPIKSRPPLATPISVETELAASLKSVTVRFPGAADGQSRTVLSDVTLDVPRGQFVVLVGKSGCGKTTILNMMAGLLEPTSGMVLVAGTTPRLANKSVGYMFARDALLPWRDARRNIEYALEVRRVPKAERRRLSQTYLDKVGLSHAAKLWPWQLSQGMRQRLAIARTLALEPEILLMDEPFAALDATTREAIQARFLELWESSNSTVVFVTHDLTEALLLADRIILVGNGGLVADVPVHFPRPRDLGVLGIGEEFRSKLADMRTLLTSTQ